MKCLKLFTFASYTLYLISILLVFNYLLFLRYRATLPQTTAPTHWDIPAYTDPETVAKISSIPNEKFSSFTQYTPEKQSGTIRIGCFGDSFTYGSETGSTGDFPSTLDYLFRKYGYPRVRVLNFGLPGAGFHEAFILWERIGTQYDLDYVILGPECFQWERDTSFNCCDELGPLHSRYILESQGKGVRLIDVLGSNPRERRLSGRSFIPPYRYLRYERRTPLFLKALLPHNRDLPRNPFYYYHGDFETEAHETYRILLQQMAASGVEIILYHSLQSIRDVGNAVGAENLSVFSHEQAVFDRFPNLRPLNHYSAIANFAIAQTLFHALTNSSEPATILEVTKPIRSEAEPLKPLHEYSEVFLQLAGIPIGVFCKPIANSYYASEVSFPETNICSLLILQTPQTSFVDTWFIPLDYMAAVNDDLRIEFTLGGVATKVTIGAITRVLAGGYVTIADIDPNPLVVNELEFTIDTKSQIQLFIKTLKQITDVRMYLGNHLILKQSGISQLVPPDQPEHTHQVIPCMPALGYFLTLCGCTQGLLDIDQLPETGIVNFCVRSEPDQVTFPFLSYQKSYWYQADIQHGVRKPLKR